MQGYVPESRLRMLMIGYMGSKDVTQEALGDIWGVTKQTVSYMFRHKYMDSHITVEKMRLAVDFLKMSDSDILSIFGREAK